MTVAALHSTFGLEYRVATRVEVMGEGAVWTLSVTALADLDETIDQVFELLEREGKPERLEELCPYFGCVWPAARGLVEKLLTESWRKRLSGGARVLEVGCGLALPSIVAARLGARVVATDLHPDVPLFLARNREANLTPEQQARLEFRAVDWRMIGADQGIFDLVVGSDILYEKEHPDAVARALWRCVDPRDGAIVLVDPGRPYLQAFADSLAAQAGGRPLKTEILRVRDTAPTPGKPSHREVFVLSVGGR